jgi:hypothetical protein
MPSGRISTIDRVRLIVEEHDRLERIFSFLSDA